MPNKNSIIIMGHCGKDPEVRQIQGTSFASVNIATNRKRKDRNGTEIKETDWHRVIAWGITADIIAEQFRKGDGVFVEGRMQYRTWTDNDGREHDIAEIYAFIVAKLAPSPRDNRHGTGQSAPPPTDDEIPF